MFFSREILGWIFFMAGVHKVFAVGPLEYARKAFVEPYAPTFLPVWALWAVGAIHSVVELVAGALLLIGLRIRESLIALGCVLVIVTFGHLVREPFYPFHEHVFPRLALIVLLLLFPSEADAFSVDALLRRRRPGA